MPKYTLKLNNAQGHPPVSHLKAGQFVELTLRDFHVLKHCCATHLLSKEFGVERVPDWIGHANIQSAMEYAKVTNAGSPALKTVSK